MTPAGVPPAYHGDSAMTPLTRRRFLAAPGAFAPHSALRCGRNAASKPAADTREMSMGNTRVGLALYGQLAKESGNLFLSPLSISAALAMTAAGARGTTLDE